MLQCHRLSSITLTKWRIWSCVSKTVFSCYEIACPCLSNKGLWFPGQSHLVLAVYWRVFYLLNCFSRYSTTQLKVGLYFSKGVWLASVPPFWQSKSDLSFSGMLLWSGIPWRMKSFADFCSNLCISCTCTKFKVNFYFVIAILKDSLLFKIMNVLQKTCFCYRSVGTFARALDCSSSVKQPSLHMSAAAASRDITLVSILFVITLYYGIQKTKISTVLLIGMKNMK